MTDTPQKRPWFQFHLSTAVVLMFVAAGLLWLNLPHVLIYLPLGGRPGMSVEEDCWGWPVPANYAPVHRQGWSTWQKGWNWGGIAVDILTVALVLFAVAFLCEWRIRRQERRP